MKKWISVPTLILHGILLGVASATLRSHPGVILWVGGIGLTALLIWAVLQVRKGKTPLPMGVSHATGTAVQFFVLYLLSRENLGLGGGLALFFYQIMLGVFLILTVVALLLGFAARKDAV